MRAQISRRGVLAAGLLLAGVTLGSRPGRAQAPSVLVFAAASLGSALDEVAALWAKSGEGRPRASYAASSALARQIEAGAPADLFISADRDWMDYLAERKLILPATRHDLLGNRLVLVAHLDNPLALDLKPGVDLSRALAGGKLAMGSPSAVPAGHYGRAALEALGVWASVSGQVAQAENVRAALALVARGEAMLGIVYATDALAEKGVRVVAAFAPSLHPPIVYPAAIVAGRDRPETRALLAYLGAAAAQAIFRRWGFTAPGA
ncbi:MAG: molybdate ABC transporter substrate-binding protein [Alphaproteobacteria bacterium]|nr:molybdate ABC transporter substrate-binding protein [Alphaproteobacteria bacterium]